MLSKPVGAQSDLAVLVSCAVVLVCCGSGLLWFWSAVVLVCCGSGLLWFWSAVVLVCCGSGLLWFWSAVVRRAGQEGLEPPTAGFGDRNSDQLSYCPSWPRAPSPLLPLNSSGDQPRQCTGHGRARSNRYR